MYIKESLMSFFKDFIYLFDRKTQREREHNRHKLLSNLLLSNKTLYVNKKIFKKKSGLYSFSSSRLTSFCYFLSLLFKQ